MERRRSLGSLKSFFWYAPQLSEASILCFHVPNFLRTHHREWLQFGGCWRAGVLSFWSSLRAHQLTILVAAIADDCDIFVYWRWKVLVAQLCPTLCDPVDCNLPCSSVHMIFQTRILEWVASPFSRGFSWPRDQTRVFCIAGRLFTI